MRPLQERLAIIGLWRAGHSARSLARRSGIPRRTIRDWIRHFAGVAQTAEATDLKSVQWGFESLHQHQHAAYVSLPGLYLGDGCINRTRRTYRLGFFLNDGQPHVIDEASQAIALLLPRRVGLGRRDLVRIVTACWGGWPSLFPQHGPGRKHSRKIALEPWQEKLVAAHPDQFVRGCIHSDGCRHRRIVNGTNYPACASSNRVVGHSHALRVDVSAPRSPGHPVEPDRYVHRSPA